MNRRSLDFRTFEQVLDDLDRLEKVGYSMAGNWNLGQMSNHLAKFVKGSLDGFAERMPWYQRLFAPLFLWWMIRQRSMPAGVSIPDSLRPDPAVEERPEVENLKQLLLRFRDHRGPVEPSPWADHLTYEKWKDLHLIHCAHHLSFLHPNR